MSLLIKCSQSLIAVFYKRYRSPDVILHFFKMPLMQILKWVNFISQALDSYDESFHPRWYDNLNFSPNAHSSDLICVGARWQPFAAMKSAHFIWCRCKSYSRWDWALKTWPSTSKLAAADLLKCHSGALFQLKFIFAVRSSERNYLLEFICSEALLKMCKPGNLLVVR